MAEIILTLKYNLKVPLDASVISPDNFAGRSINEISSLKLWRGNKQVSLGEVFDVKGEAGSTANETNIIINGDLSKARRIGKDMSNGKIVVNGPAGLYVGEGIRGGVIMVNGDAGPWAGVGAKGGLIEIMGNAGDFLASSYRGARSGMEGGTIIVHGNAANEVGGWMKNGTVKIMGNAGIFIGPHMQGGSILVSGDCGGRAGAGMKGGRIVILGYIPSILPGFRIEEIRGSVRIDGDRISGPFYLFNGDYVEDGRGNLFISVNKNQHLKRYEQYIP
ncbi:MAG: formylmethanofuran dehydrogenase subunit C [Nitrososphaerota archaeon]|nr:formylmethanofuran dehydrogenase subunit C [Nitrososphaerota archaeon]